MIDTSKYGRFMLNAHKKTKEDIKNFSSYFANMALNNHVKNAIESGIDGFGVKDNKIQYSDKRIPTWILEKQAVNYAGLIVSEYYTKLSWHEFRVIQGLKSEFVNLKYTGEFWKSFRVITGSSAILIIYIGDLDKFNDLIDYYGEFLNLHKEDLHELAKTLLPKYDSIFKKNNQT